jgi:uncharacterized protein (TIRG00374 family)
VKIVNNNLLKQESSLPKVRYYRYLPLIIIGIAAVILLLNMSTYENIVSVLREMSIWLAGMAVIAQVCSYLSSGFLLHVIMNHGRFRLSVGRGTLVIMAAESIGLAGGFASSVAATYYWIAKGDDFSGEAVMAGILPTIYNAVVLIIITIFGMVYLMFNHDLSGNEIIFYGLILTITIVLVLISFYSLKHQEKMEHFIIIIVKKLKRFIKIKYDFIVISNIIDQFYNGVKLLSNRGWLKIGFGPTMNIVFDIFTIYLFFTATGYFVKPSILIAGYGLSFLFGRGAFFIPGGVGIVEGGMVAIFTSLGVPLHFSVVAVLGYRFISFWLPSLLGFAAMIYLQKTSVQHNKLTS